jgi:hypothetical protein
VQQGGKGGDGDGASSKFLTSAAGRLTGRRSDEEAESGAKMMPTERKKPRGGGKEVEDEAQQGGAGGRFFCAARRRQQGDIGEDDGGEEADVCAKAMPTKKERQVGRSGEAEGRRSKRGRSRGARVGGLAALHGDGSRKTWGTTMEARKERVARRRFRRRKKGRAS